MDNNKLIRLTNRSKEYKKIKFNNSYYITFNYRLSNNLNNERFNTCSKIDYCLATSNAVEVSKQIFVIPCREQKPDLKAAIFWNLIKSETEGLLQEGDKFHVNFSADMDKGYLSEVIEFNNSSLKKIKINSIRN